MRRILKNNSGSKMKFAICWPRSSHFHLLKQKSNCLSHIVTPFMNVLFGVIHSGTKLENLLSVNYSNTFKHLINVFRYASSSLAIAMHATNHINVVFHKFTYSLMSRVIAPTVLFQPLSIAMHIISLH